MLFVILLSGIMAVLFQVGASPCPPSRVYPSPGPGHQTRLCHRSRSLLPLFSFPPAHPTFPDLAAHCRILLHDHPKHPRLVRFLLLYPLYVLAELAIIATDLAELLGSAIGFILLIPSLPVWAGVLLTALDIFVFLLITDHSHPGRPVRLVEIGIIFLVRSRSHFLFVTHLLFPSGGCCLCLFHRPRHQGRPRLVPSLSRLRALQRAIRNPTKRHLCRSFDSPIPPFPPLTLSYPAIGIIGATVMPHGLFLGSHFSTQDRLTSLHPALPSPVATQRSSLRSSLQQRCRNIFSSKSASQDDCTDKSTRHELRQNNRFPFIQAHLTHAIVDIIFSLLVVAVPINSAYAFSYLDPQQLLMTNIQDPHHFCRSALRRICPVITRDFQYI